MSSLNNLKKTKEEITSIYNNITSSKELIEISNKEEIYSIAKEIEKDILKIEELKLFTLLNEEYDKEDCIMEIHAGAGGTEACDWVLMLSRMYQKYFDNKAFKSEIIDYLDGEEAGIKSIVISIKGEYAYGLLKSESGVHRLVRISPFDSNARRHTSFASVLVTPMIDKEINIDINPNDLRVDVYRSSGKGGQGVNTTDSAVRLTHIPTNIVVTCQSERSQIQNKETALKVLKARIYEAEQEKRDLELGNERRSKIGTGSRSEKIRTYNYPQNRVTDHRIGFSYMNLDRVMEGDLAPIIQALIDEDEKRKLESNES